MRKTINKKHNLMCSTITATITIMLLFTISISSNFNDNQLAAAQNTNNTIGTFDVSGYAGQIFVLPQSVTQTPNPSISQLNLSPPPGSIIAGNWSFAVNGGKLQDFKWKVEFIALNGKVNGTSSITGITNSSGAVAPSTNSNIQLSAGNNTAFKANADVNINGKTAFNDVPIVLYLLDGKLINLSIDPAKTGGYFTTPIFGIVTSLTR
jgi:hypothetical protein